VAARRLLAERGVSAEMIERQGIGYAPSAREGLKQHLLEKGFAQPVLMKSGLVLQRDSGTIVDRFRTRIMIPIHRDSGTIIAFGGRAMEAGQQPKYLNSPETAIYVKGRTLYGLHLGKSAISRTKHAVMVEGYFDWAQAFQAGITNVVASSGTALTPAQVRLLKRFATKVVLSFDPDAAGQGAAARSSELLVSEGFQVNVAMLPAGDDPDNFIRKHGGAAYQERLRTSTPYLEYLLDRTAAGHDFNRDDSRRTFLESMLTIAARIPDAAARDQFADRLAHKARITEEVVRAEIRKAAVQKQTNVEALRVPVLTQLQLAEKGLIWAVLRQPLDGVQALAHLDEEDLAGLASSSILQQARSLQGVPSESLPSTLMERLTKGEARLVAEVGQPASAPASPADCVLTLKKRRFDRERAELQRQIDRLQEQGGASDHREMDVLLTRKRDLARRIEEMGAGKIA
jgi:DNA primase